MVEIEDPVGIKKSYSNLAPEILTISAKAGASARKWTKNSAGDLEVVISMPWAAKRCFTPGWAIPLEAATNILLVMAAEVPAGKYSPYENVEL